ncbi:MAG: PilZ domain-containing protein [Acidobacteria bacterium]|nr:PilZ domain-containing protein [Acidobacteriota bacterium]
MSFYFRRPLEVGQIILVSLPLPTQMRRFDEKSDEYSVWSVVRFCRSVLMNYKEAHQIGVAFTGKDPPPGYLRNPFCLYEASGYDGDEFWKVTETGSTMNRRRHLRYALPISVTLDVCDADGNVTAHEQTVTENISVSGATVYTSLPLKVGDFVKFQSVEYNVTLVAEVRNVRTGTDGMPRAHLRFADGAFPLEGIDRS